MLSLWYGQRFFDICVAVSGACSSRKMVLSLFLFSLIFFYSCYMNVKTIVGAIKGTVFFYSVIHIQSDSY